MSRRSVRRIVGTAMAASGSSMRRLSAARPARPALTQVMALAPRRGARSIRRRRLRHAHDPCRHRELHQLQAHRLRRGVPGGLLPRRPELPGHRSGRVHRLHAVRGGMPGRRDLRRGRRPRRPGAVPGDQCRTGAAVAGADSEDPGIARCGEMGRRPRQAAAAAAFPGRCTSPASGTKSPARAGPFVDWRRAAALTSPRPPAPFPGTCSSSPTRCRTSSPA